MQTFLPFGIDYEANAQILDNKRLGKQRVESYQILKALLGESKGWVNHPATRMWRGHEYQLFIYTSIICREWKLRGFNDTVTQSIQDLISNKEVEPNWIYPDWLYFPAIQITHKANLFIKNPEHYSRFAKYADIYRDYVCCADKCNYYWPLHTKEVKL